MNLMFNVTVTVYGGLSILDACEVCKQEQTACYTFKCGVMGQANRCKSSLIWQL